MKHVTPKEAFSLHREYKEQLKHNNFNIVKAIPKDAPVKPPPLVFLKTAATKYSDFLQDIDVPIQERRKLSPEYVQGSNTVRYPLPDNSPEEGEKDLKFPSRRRYPGPRDRLL